MKADIPCHGRSSSGQRPPLLVNTLKILAAVAMIAYVAANWLPAASGDRQAGGRDMAVASRVADDPETTGSLPGEAGPTRLDPCAVPLRH